MSYLPIPVNRNLKLSAKTTYWVIAAILVSNVFTYLLFKSGGTKRATASVVQTPAENNAQFYLLDQAQTYVMEPETFAQKVKEVANSLNVPPEWLMAVMYSESKFDASATNKNNGATGLIQWKPEELQRMGLTAEKVRNLSYEDQLMLVKKYYQQVKKEYKPFENLTEFYLGAFYPEALGEDYCYALYKQNENGYKTYSLLDMNKDGQITIKDIDEKMKRMFPTAYMIERPQPTGIRAWLGW
ncbi:hypothetical protein C7N43_23955 [Sphingobacteriales bacterium UPWRP_1]|nr:hypothetical protein B6N25_15765 [Sphingobacteriales bacterium TSM_CSS]PSJ74452.1 hypothetical protein C7N43_23955 [Sphingobacteriales bacterium UPWRP_1]